jgi:hypothetical protein
MKITRRHAIVAGLGTASYGLSVSSLLAGFGKIPPGAKEIKGGEKLWLATNAYIYGYPLVTMEISRRVTTNVVQPGQNRAPMGHLLMARDYPEDAYRDGAAPPAEMVSLDAWIDVGKEPWVLSIPDMKDRYFLFSMLDGWTNVFEVPGKRTTGTNAQTYAITGPGWEGTLPSGVEEYKSPTSIVWIRGRIYCNGTPEDYAAVTALHDQFKLVPLGSYGQSYTPPAGTVDPSIDMTTSVRDQVNSMDGISYLTLLAELMKTNPPAAEDSPELARFGELGLVAGKDFDAKKLGEEFALLPQYALPRIFFPLNEAVANVNGWTFDTETGIYGTNYINRALVAALGVGSDKIQDSISLELWKDAEDENTDGANKYVMRFPKDQLPPAHGFWCITVHNPDHSFVANPKSRYSISAEQNLKPNPDGSIDLYIQNQSPGADKESNWLPAPTGPFVLRMNLYQPTEKSPSIINGTWTPPAVKKVT